MWSTNLFAALVATALVACSNKSSSTAGATSDMASSTDPCLRSVEQLVASTELVGKLASQPKSSAANEYRLIAIDAQPEPYFLVRAVENTKAGGTQNGLVRNIMRFVVDRKTLEVHAFEASSSPTPVDALKQPVLSIDGAKRDAAAKACGTGS